MPTNFERSQNNFERAKALAAVGFENETRRKDALSYLSSAYYELRKLVSDATWEAIRARGTQVQQRDWDMAYPCDLHNVRQKHADYALEIAPATKDFVALISTLKAKRDEYRALPLTPKVKKPVVIQPGDKTQQRGNCQCCGRDQAINHTVAKHGYEVKNRGQGGYFRGVCSGHNYEPMQVKRDITDVVISGCRADAERLDERVAGLRSGKLTPDYVRGHYNPKTREYDQLLFEDGSPSQKREAIVGEVYRCESRARAARSAADDLEKLVNEVHGQPLRIVKV